MGEWGGDGWAVRLGEGLTIDTGGQHSPEILVRGSEVDHELGAFVFTHGQIPENPPHAHFDFMKIVFVLEGEYAFRVGDVEFSGEPGTLVVVPKGSQPTFTTATRGRGALRLFAIGDEEMFIEMGELGSGATPEQFGGPERPLIQPPCPVRAEHLSQQMLEAVMSRQMVASLLSTASSYRGSPAMSLAACFKMVGGISSTRALLGPSRCVAHPLEAEDPEIVMEDTRLGPATCSLPTNCCSCSALCRRSPSPILGKMLRRARWYGLDAPSGGSSAPDPGPAPRQEAPAGSTRVRAAEVEASFRFFDGVRAGSRSSVATCLRLRRLDLRPAADSIVRAHIGRWSRPPASTCAATQAASRW